MTGGIKATKPRNVLTFFLTLVPISFFWPVSWGFLLWSAMLAALSVYRSPSVDVSILLFVTLASFYNWSYLAIGAQIFDWNYFLPAVLVRFLALAVVFGFAFRYFRLKWPLDWKFCTLSILIIVSFGRSAEISIALSYLVNVYAPFLLFIYLAPRLLSENTSNSVSAQFPVWPFSPFIIFFIIFTHVMAFCFEVFGFVDLENFFRPVAENLRGGGGGNFSTILLGLEISRFPGLFADPIVAGYAINIFFFAGMLFIKSILGRAILGVFSIFAIALTFSKGAYVLIILGFFGLICWKLSIGARSRLVIFALGYVVSFLGVAIRAAMEGVTDSSAIHYLGLIGPFQGSISLSYFFGNDLGSGGNLGGWVAEGAESFVGLLMYNTGLVGVVIYFWIFASMAWVSMKRRDIFAKFFVAAILPIFWTSFLQENVFNLSFSLPRLCAILFVCALAARPDAKSHAMR